MKPGDLKRDENGELSAKAKLFNRVEEQLGLRPREKLFERVYECDSKHEPAYKKRKSAK